MKSPETILNNPYVAVGLTILVIATIAINLLFIIF